MAGRVTATGRQRPFATIGCRRSASDFFAMDRHTRTTAVVRTDFLRGLREGAGSKVSQPFAGKTAAGSFGLGLATGDINAEA